MSELQTTSPNRPWLIKMLLFVVVLIGFGIWGYYDATIKYPARGENAAEYRLLEYLEAAERAGPVTFVDLKVEKPQDELSRLEDAVGAGQATELEAARYRWLKSLDAIGKLDAGEIEKRLTDNPREVKNALSTRWATKTQPKPLAWFDIPLQWAITFIGFGGGLLMIAHMARVMSRKYRWDAEQRRLVLPGGAEVTPAHLADVDKRKWHKYLVFLKIKPDHPSLGGQEIKLDLYQHAELEDWVLAMEREAFPERAEEDKPAEPPAPEHADESQKVES